MGKLPGNIESFLLYIDQYAFDAAATRNMFDHSPKLLQFCENCIGTDALKANIEFDKDMNEACAADIYSMLLENREDVYISMLSLLEADQEEGIYLWGAGYHGCAMCAYLESNGVKIKGIIDTNKHGIKLGKYVILSPEQITGDCRVFISITDRHAVKSIKSKMQEKNSEIKLADYYELRKMIK